MKNSKEPKKTTIRFFEVLASLAGGGSPGSGPPEKPTSSFMGQLIRQRQMKGKPNLQQSTNMNAAFYFAVAFILMLSVYALSMLLSS